MTALPDRTTFTEFLDWEQDQPACWEFTDGYAWPMAATSDAHAQIILNVGTLIRTRLRGNDFRAFANAAKVVAAGRNTYPDLIVTCDPRDRANRYSKRHPRLLVEVLSKTTAGVDLSDKFAAYRRIETLTEYFTPDNRKRAARLWRRNTHRHWELVEDRTLAAGSFARMLARDIWTVRGALQSLHSASRAELQRTRSACRQMA